MIRGGRRRRSEVRRHGVDPVRVEIEHAILMRDEETVPRRIEGEQVPATVSAQTKRFGDMIRLRFRPPAQRHEAADRDENLFHPNALHRVAQSMPRGHRGVNKV